MTTSEFPTATASQLRTHLELLQIERATAGLTGLTAVRSYMEDLDGELQAARDAYVGAAVTEIASLRSALNGPLVG